jgi:hypothetical protein
VRTPKSHLERLMKRLCSYNLVKTRLRCSAHDELYTKTSSKKMRMNRWRKGRNTSFIKTWKVMGEFIQPNDMTKNSKRPSCVRNADFSTLSSFMRTSW